MLKTTAAACLIGGLSLIRAKELIRDTMLIEEVPPVIQSLGTGLMRVLEGERGPAATADLDPRVVPLVESVLDTIKRAMEGSKQEGSGR
jgi:hypothetical protein